MGNFAMLPIGAISDNRLSLRDIRTLAAIARRVGKASYKLTLDRIAEDSGIHRPHVPNSIKRLAEFGWITVEKGTGRTSNTYKINFDFPVDNSSVIDTNLVPANPTRSRYQTGMRSRYQIGTKPEPTPYIDEKTNEETKKKKYIKKKISKIFTKPKPAEVAEYGASISFEIDGEHFCDYYESKGWMVGSNRMKDWKAAVRTWKRNGYATTKVNGHKLNGKPKWASVPNYSDHHLVNWARENGYPGPTRTETNFDYRARLRNLAEQRMTKEGLN